MSKFANIQFKNSTSEVQAKVQLITFTENEICFCHCPQLNTTGYGHNEQEAFDSFNIVIKEFFNYTTNKKTLGKILENLGWKIKKGSTKKPTNMNFFWLKFFSSRKVLIFRDISIILKII